MLIGTLRERDSWRLRAFVRDTNICVMLRYLTIVRRAAPMEQSAARAIPLGTVHRDVSDVC